MESLVSQFLSFPPKPLPPDHEYDKAIKAHLKLLNTTGGHKLRGGDSGARLLEVFDPSVNSLPFLFTLLAHQAHQPGDLVPGSSLWEHATTFLLTFDPIQIRCAGFEFTRLLQEMGRAVELTNNVSAAAGPMCAALLRLDPSSATMTSTHVYVLRLCLLARDFDTPRPILDNHIFHFPTKDKTALLPPLCAQHTTSSTYVTSDTGFSAKLEYQDALLYHLYGGMIYLGARKWSRAARYFELVMTHPTTQAPSMIQVEAYKKWILANLLESGNVPGLSRDGLRGVHPPVAKHLRALGKPYEALAEAFKDPRPSTLNAEIDVGERVWQHDSNTGLVLQVLAARQRFALIALSKTYTSLTLDVVAQLPAMAGISISDIQQYVHNLIAMGQLHATLIPDPNPSKSILRFQQEGGPSDDLDAETELLQAKSRLAALDRHMQISQRRMEVSKEYVEAERKLRKNRTDAAEASQGADRYLPGQMMDYQDEEALEDI